MASTCTLCQHLIQLPVYQGSLSFCCKGCAVVFSILEQKGGTEQFKTDPLFVEAIKRGIVTNPELVQEVQEAERLKKKASDETLVERVIFEIENLFCPSCQQLIEWVLAKEKGVLCVGVDYLTDLCSVTYDPKQMGKASIQQLLKKIGYLAKEPLDKETKRTLKPLHLQVGVALFFALNTMMCSYPIFASLWEQSGEELGHFFAWVSLGLTLPVVFYSAYPIYKKAWISAKWGFFGMESLITLSIVSAFVLSLWNQYRGFFTVYYDSMTVLIALVLVGKLVEGKAKGSAKKALFSLYRSLPKKVRIRREGACQFLGVKEVVPEDIAVVYTGEKLPLDGVVEEGSAFIDTSQVTGESAPVFVSEGSSVVAGSHVVSGSLSYRIGTTPTSLLETMFDKLSVMLESKGTHISLIEQVSLAFVPFVVLLALCTLFVTGDVDAFLSILLISCPCAIGIAVPLVEAEMGLVLLEQGVVLRRREALLLLGKVSRVVFDKTATLTQKSLNVTTDIEKLPAAAKGRLYSLASHSIHPISQAIAKHISGITPALLSNVREEAGSGVGCAEGYYLGSARWIQELGGPYIEGARSVYWEKGGEAFAFNYIDQLREEASFVAQAVQPTLLSGDLCCFVEEVATRLDIKEWYGEMDPFAKLQLIQQWQEKCVVAMCGDGVNDALALAAASVSFAPLEATEMAKETADFFLTGDLKSLVFALDLGKKGLTIVKQNIFWAFFYNVLGLFLAVFGVLTPLFATGAMMVSSLMVLGNAKRIRYLTRKLQR